MNSDGPEWIEEGLARVPIEAGSYRIDVQISDARAGDLFGTRILSGDTYFEVGFGGEVVTRSIGFDPEWRVNLSFTNETFGPLSDQQIRLINLENSGQIITRMTDFNGTLIDHLPQGNWIIVVDSIETGQGIFEGARTAISVSEQTATNSTTIRTSELSSFSIIITDENGISLENMELLLTSNEGLGRVYLDSTDGSGLTSDSIPLGLGM